MHKDPNNGSQDIFLLLTFLLYALYFSSFFFFFKGLFFNFTPLEKKKKTVRLLNEAEKSFKNACRRQKDKLLPELV